MTVSALALTVAIAAAAPAAGGPVQQLDAEAEALFRDAGVEGAFVLLDVSRNTLRVVNPGLAAQGYLPCSTFKIPHTLIGLGAGVIPDRRFRLKWDGTEHRIPAWNRDHDLPSALQNSVVWFYQEVARRLGKDRLQRELKRLSYGNADVGGPEDRFWLDGALRISALQQVEFLRRLQEGSLPVRAEHASLVRELLVLDQRDGYTLRGKTGLCGQDSRTVGWLVGEVQKGDARWVYATLVLGGPEAFDQLIPLRRKLTERLLSRYGAGAE